jgi:deoxyribonuclease V
MTIVLPDIPDLPSCLERLWNQIPAGRVATYGDLAEALGDRIAARWVGHHALHHLHDDSCPCHRIVRADGSLGGYVSGRVEDKERRLRREGAAPRNGLVNLAELRFCHFETDRPLMALRRAQEAIVHKASLRPPKKPARLVAGVDVSYTASGEGVAACVLVEAASGEVLGKTIVRRPIRFPYITSFLSFRELPLLVELLDEVDRQGRRADVVLVDGSGMLHHRHAGIATHLGVLRGQSTVGVTKKLLCGSVDLKGLQPAESRPVLLDGEPIGVALRPTAGSRRPIFLSPGHRIDPAAAEAVVRGLLHGRRLPEPLYWADRLSRKAAREPGS